MKENANGGKKNIYNLIIYEAIQILSNLYLYCHIKMIMQSRGLKNIYSALLNVMSLLASMVPLRTFNTHEPFLLHGFLVLYSG